MQTTLERPWNGLDMLKGELHPTQVADLTWDVEKRPVYQKTDDGEWQEISEFKTLVRKDTGKALSVVSNKYQPYTNSAMWNIIDEYCKASGGTIDAAGIMGKDNFVWCTVKHNDYEIVKNDTITTYDMFVNPYVPGITFSMINSDIRAVCGNMLNSILSASKSCVRIRHTKNIPDRVSAAVQAASISKQNHNNLIEYMQFLAKRKVNEKQIDAFIQSMIPTADENKIPQKTKARRDDLYSLIDNGMGTEIKGVRGTAYGLLQAGIEFADHYMAVREGPRLYKTTYGSVYEFKNKVSKKVMELIK